MGPPRGERFPYHTPLDQNKTHNRDSKTFQGTWERTHESSRTQSTRDQEGMDQNSGVHAVVNPVESRNTTTSNGTDTHMKWLDNGSAGSQSADDEEQSDADEEPIEFDDQTSEISSTPLAKSMTKVYLQIG